MGRIWIIRYRLAWRKTIITDEAAERTRKVLVDEILQRHLPRRNLIQHGHCSSFSYPHQQFLARLQPTLKFDLKPFFLRDVLSQIFFRLTAMPLNPKCLSLFLQFIIYFF